MIVGIDRSTVARKLRFWGLRSRLDLEKDRRGWKLSAFQFDELETFERTKYLPLSVAMAVSPDRRILGIEVARMPCKGPLAERSREKYGPRVDQRSQALKRLFRALRPTVRKNAIIQSDQNPRYPDLVERFFPEARHLPVPGVRGCVTGQGELKAAGFDPIFSLNHTFAMLRANICRLVRRTWCTTKKADRLFDHLAIYASFHNAVLLKRARYARALLMVRREGGAMRRGGDGDAAVAALPTAIAGA